MMRVLVVDTDQERRTELEEILRSDDWEVDFPEDHYDALTHIKYILYCWDVAIIRPHTSNGMSGFELVRAVRNMETDIPILMLGLESVEERNEGFSAGADDCQPDSIDATELLHRIRAVVRRSLNVAQDEVVIGALSFNPFMNNLYIDGDEVNIKFSPSERKVLGHLVKNARREVFASRENLFCLLHPDDEYDCETDVKVVNVFISKIRTKLKKLLGTSICIECMEDFGYRLVLKETELNCGTGLPAHSGLEFLSRSIGNTRIPARYG